ncbi:Phage integrase family [Aerococcus viridans]|uniref:Tyr recombinase domain-containing protein n=2 Tax=Aerococcus viridans TaxID=1377 RepID=A0AAU8U1V8_9LACT|nr:tyrosine-type recombinase/integrase [Aerococcus viridans]AMC00209.1 hypothetical protein AWM76_00800 [Aerococcus viridans]EFG50332.1 site-specific recombinase, phage integrase family [Aerococcus viridans ATCC 11563 = CCUG 4311]SUU10259.1 Phage integrase family [Aerococcus viridans]
MIEQEKLVEDPLLWEYIQGFYTIESETNGVYQMTYKLKNYIIPLFKEVKCTQITLKWLIDVENKGLISSRGRSTIARFIGYLTMNDLIRKSELKRIYECRSAFYERVMEGDFGRLLTIAPSVYKEFKANNDLSNRNLVRLLLVHVPETTSESLNKYINRYIEHIKLLSDTSSNGSFRLREIAKIGKIVEGLLLQNDISKITSSEIVKFLKSPEYQNITNNTFVDFFIGLVDEGLIKDLSLCHFFKELKKDSEVYRLTCFKTEKFIDCLSTVEPYSIFFITKTYQNKKLYVVTNKNKELRPVIIEYIDDLNYNNNEINMFLKYFDDSLGTEEVNRLSDLTYKIFNIQIEYFMNTFNDAIYLTYLIDFYQFLMNRKVNVLQDISMKRFLKRTGLAQDLFAGFEVIPYQSFENVPDNDKWLLIYTESQCTNDGISTTMSSKLDFSTVADEKLKYAMKHYIWYQGAAINTKIKNMRRITAFIGFLHSYSRENISHISSAKTATSVVNLNKIIAYKGIVIGKYNESKSIFNQLYAVRNFLNHACDYKLLEIENGYEYFLQSRLDSNHNDSNPITDEHFTVIFEHMKLKAQEKDINELYLIVYYLLSVTEIRPSNIVSLRVDCVKEIGHEQFAIFTETKTSNKQQVLIPIVSETKKLLDEVIRITEPVRQQSSNKDNDKYLFLIASPFRRSSGVMRLEQFNEYLVSICEELNIQRYTASNLRDRYMTKTDDFIIKNSYSELQQKVLTGHSSSNTTNTYYVGRDVKDSLSAVNGIIIGEDKSLSMEKSTSDVGVKVPINKLLFDDEFITTPDFIPYYKYHLDEIINEIELSNNIDKIAELMTYKALLEGYLEKLYEKDTRIE